MRRFFNDFLMTTALMTTLLFAATWQNALAEVAQHQEQKQQTIENKVQHEERYRTQQQLNNQQGEDHLQKQERARVRNEIRIREVQNEEADTNRVMNQDQRDQVSFGSDGSGSDSGPGGSGSGSGGGGNGSGNGGR